MPYENPFSKVILLQDDPLGKSLGGAIDAPEEEIPEN